MLVRSDRQVNDKGQLGRQLLINAAGSEGRRNTCAQFTRWSLKAQSFSRALI